MTQAETIDLMIEAIGPNEIQAVAVLANGASVYGRLNAEGDFMPACNEPAAWSGIARLLDVIQPEPDELPTWARPAIRSFVTDFPEGIIPGMTWTIVKGDDA